MELGNFRKKIISDEIVDAVKEKIIKGELKPGEKLPPQGELARQLGVSRTSLREAINKLSTMGLVESRQGLGTYITSMNPASFMRTFYHDLLMNRAAVAELLEARIFIERATVFLAAMKANMDDLMPLQESVKKQRAVICEADYESFSQLDLQFHMTLAKISQNSVLEKTLKAVRELLQKFISEANSTLPGACERAVKYHSRIVEAVLAHRAAQAERLLVEHLLDVSRAIEEHFGYKLDLDYLKGDPPADSGA